MPSSHISLVACVVLVLAAASTGAGDWPQFRGPNSQSISDEKNLPLRWNKDGQGVLWKAPLPRADNGFSSPIVCKGRVFLTTATNHPLTHAVLCFDAQTGALLWQTAVDPGPWKLGDLRGGYAASTPAADDQHIYALFGSAVVACLDYSGKIVWRRDFNNTNFDVAIGTSPILFGDSILLQFDQNGGKSQLIALSKPNGQTLWHQPRPEQVFTHSTPVIARVGGKPQLIVSASNAMQGIDPATGNLLWSVPSSGETCSVAVGDHLAYVDTGRGGGGVCVDLNPEPPAVKWRAPGGEMGEGLGSPLIVNGLLYKMHRGDVLLCKKADTGQILFSQHLPGVSSWSSPFVSADGLIFFASAGKSMIIHPGEKLDIVAESDLADPNNAPSPAISNGRIYLRGMRFLYCVGSR